MGTGGHQVQCGGEVLDDGHPREHRRQSAQQPIRRVHQVDRPQGALRQRSTILARGGGPIRQHDRRPPAVGVFEGLNR